MKQCKHLLIVIVMLLAALPVMAQVGNITLSFNDESLPSALRKLEKASDYKISFAYNDVEKYRVSGQVKNSSFKAVLDFLLKGKPLSYEFRGKFVDIKAGKPGMRRLSREVTGMVKDENGEPLPGATVTCLGGSGGRESSTVVTDMNGHFKLSAAGDATKLEVSYIGFTNKTIALTSASSYEIQMQPDSKAIEEVVVTGVFTRKANTFTGAVTTIKGDDLKRVGNANVLQSLKNIDPSFMQVENLGMGSDPNSLPDFQMRGASTISGVQGEYASSANQPLFILNGCKDIRNARFFRSNTTGMAFYYATDKAAYSFSASSGQTTSNVLYTCEAGEEITAMYAWGSAGGGWPTSDCILWIGVWNSNTQEGKLIQYEMDVNYGLPNSMWGPMFGAPDNPIVTTGWGKIVDMVCIDAE